MSGGVIVSEAAFQAERRISRGAHDSREIPRKPALSGRSDRRGGAATDFTMIERPGRKLQLWPCRDSRLRLSGGPASPGRSAGIASKTDPAFDLVFPNAIPNEAAPAFACPERSRRALFESCAAVFVLLQANPGPAPA